MNLSKQRYNEVKDAYQWRNATRMAEGHVRLSAWKATRYCLRCYMPHPNPPSERLCIECERDLRA